MPEYHVKIFSFDEKVLVNFLLCHRKSGQRCLSSKVMVMSSIRKPKVIKILGNDQREYKYLVKGGEDLRLDQRIQQLFDVMNQVLAQDATCRERKLHLKTYEVGMVKHKV